MAANPEILSALNEHVYNKTGKRVLDLGAGDPPTGGDKGKDGKGAKPAPATPLPLPDYNDPKSREAYALAMRKKYNLPEKMGDTFLRFNEVPDTRTDTLTSRQLAFKHAAASGLPAPLLYTSAMVEGMSGLYPYGKNNDVDWSGNEKFPVHGFKNFGLDTFSDAYPGLVKKGYLPADFNKQFIPSTQTNEKGKKVNSAYFQSADAALQAKAAMMRDAQDQVNAYATKNKIPLSDKAKQFLTLAYYNGGPGAFQGMIKEAQTGNGLANDAYFNTKPAQSNYGQVWDNVNQRFQLANALTGEGYQFEDTPPPQQPTQQAPKYVTSLNPTEESSYQAWRNKLPRNLRNDSDYDLRGLYKSNPNVQPTANLHFEDTYKRPNHITFSDESKYNDPKSGVTGGHWGNKNGKDVFYASATNVKNAGDAQKLQEYFKKYEPTVELVLPDSTGKPQFK